jgi:hypothetical protein
MKYHYTISIAVCSIGIALMTLLSCGGKSFDYHSGNEIPEGSGVFSGENGEFTIYDSKAGRPDEKSESVEGAGNQAAEKSGTAEAADVSSTETDEYKEFQEFQQWKQEKKEFEDFQNWKKSKQGSQEYREFLEWKKWREFKQWQEGQNKKQ